jgi:hypothetical protein
MRADIIRELIDIAERDINDKCAKEGYICNTNDMEMNFMKAGLGAVLSIEFICDIFYKDDNMLAGCACGYYDIIDGNIRFGSDVIIDIDVTAENEHNERHGL